MPVTGNTNLQLRYDVPSTAATAGTATDSVPETYAPGWSPGTGAAQFDLAASAIGALSSSTNTHILSAFPAATGTVPFARIKEFYLKNTGTTAITVTPGGSRPWVAAFASDLTVTPGAVVFFSASDATAYPVTSGSADKFTVVCAGTGAYKLILKGASA